MSARRLLTAVGSWLTFIAVCLTYLGFTSSVIMLVAGVALALCTAAWARWNMVPLLLGLASVALLSAIPTGLLMSLPSGPRLLLGSALLLVIFSLGLLARALVLRHRA